MKAETPKHGTTFSVIHSDVDCTFAYFTFALDMQNFDRTVVEQLCDDLNQNLLTQDSLGYEYLAIGETESPEIDEQGNINVKVKIPKGIKLGKGYYYKSTDDYIQALRGDFGGAIGVGVGANLCCMNCKP